MSTVKIRERHIDRLLAEELKSSPQFALWFCRRVFRKKPPENPPDSCEPIISHRREDRYETDVHVEMKWPSGDVRIIHIEDKIKAVAQPNQAEHYKEYVNREKKKLAEENERGDVECALVCPESWILSHPKQSGIYHARITFEEIAKEFESRAEDIVGGPDEHREEIRQRLLFRKGLLNDSMRQKTTYDQIAAGDITTWNDDAAKLFDVEKQLVLKVQQRLRSKSGHTKPGRFFPFEISLTPYNNQGKPKLQLKTLDKKPGRVSLEIPHAGDDLDLEEEAKGKGYDVGRTRAGTLVIGGTTERLKKLNLDEPVADQIDALRDAAEIALELINWWETRA